MIWRPLFVNTIPRDWSGRAEIRRSKSFKGKKKKKKKNQKRILNGEGRKRIRRKK